MATLSEAITAAQAIIDEHVAAARYIPENPPDAIGHWPAVVVYPASMAFDYESMDGPDGNGHYGGVVIGRHMLAVAVLVPHKDMARAVAQLRPFIDSIPKALLQHPTLSGTVEVATLMRGVMGPDVWGDGQEVIGLKFMLEITQRTQM